MTDRGDILIVDDEPDIRGFLSAVLADEGFAVRSAGDGSQALEALASSRPALVILDLMMPQVSGLQVLEALQARPETARIPVIVLSAKASHRDILEALDMGAVDFGAEAV